MVLKKAGGEKFDIEGQLFNEAKMKMIIDGYAAPVTSGNFVDLVEKGTLFLLLGVSRVISSPLQF